eukprot:TRINITY_DN227_c0_g1_i1.p1 TRINITY_DN227_c0_g1~~TRINITY_DN227_c0_g1_i1.p1  ORF type:complete len:495 (+),score=57.81 TRINITY_DN227_c0_g1_i1:73-1557(+)
MKTVILLLFLGFCLAFTPYTPTAGWTYYIEASRALTWPSCPYRFLSFPSTCDAINLWSGAGINQQFTFVQVPGTTDTFYLKTSCGRYVSYPGDCSQDKIDTWPEAGVNQAFRFSPSNSGGAFEYFIEALGRQNCPLKWLSFPVPCTTNQPDLVDLWSAAGQEQTFRIHPVGSGSPVVHHWNDDRPCADPFAWYSNSTKNFELLCTSGSLELSYSTDMNPGINFNYLGGALSPNNVPGWANNGNRWAPENIEVSIGGTDYNVIFWAQFISAENTHRIGWVSSSTTSLPGKWDHYAPNHLFVGQASGGDIDAHVFFDRASNSHYLIWKTDDNNVGMKYTRIWGVKIAFSANPNLSVSVVGNPVVILDSNGLWWSESWISGGSLIEGPEIISYGGYYYLFFASGRYCESSYMEGAARSRNVLGPYEKMSVPLLSTGIVGVSNGKKLIGPGHASYVQDQKGNWNMVWHASTGADSACQRYPFVSNLKFTSNGWPYADF